MQYDFVSCGAGAAAVTSYAVARGQDVWTALMLTVTATIVGLVRIASTLSGMLACVTHDGGDQGACKCCTALFYASLWLKSHSCFQVTPHTPLHHSTYCRSMAHARHLQCSMWLAWCEAWLLVQVAVELVDNPPQEPL